MAVHRFSLGSLKCISPRSKPPRADWLLVTMLAVRDGQVLGAVSSLLGDGPGSRVHIPFHGGKEHSFSPTFFGTGTDRLWEIAFDVAPGLSDVELRVVAANVRDVNDPHKLARLGVAVAAVAVSTAAGVFLGEKFKEVLAKIASDPTLREIAEKAIGEAWDLFTDRLPGWLFDDDWPDCAGDVLVWSRTVSGSKPVHGGLGEVRITTAAETAASSARGCGRPHYELVAHLVDAAPFGTEQHPVVRSRYVPCRDLAPGLWQGAWQRRTADVGATIESPANRHYDVAAFERQGASMSARFAGVRETYEAWTPYASDVVPTPYAAPSDKIPGGIRLGAAAASASASVAGANTTIAGLRSGPRGAGGGGVAVATAPAPAPAPHAGAWTPAHSDLIGGQTALAGLEQGVRTLTLPNGVRLGLYMLIEEFSERSPREVGPFVRYQRDATLSASRADVMVPKFAKLA